MHAPIALASSHEELKACAITIDDSFGCLRDAPIHLTHPLLKVVILVIFFELLVIFDFLKIK